MLIWIKKVALSHQLCKDVIESTSATILPFGSYGLGVSTHVFVYFMNFHLYSIRLTFDGLKN